MKRRIVFSVWITSFLLSLSPLALLQENVKTLEEIYANVLLFAIPSIGIILAAYAIYFFKDWDKKNFAIVVFSSFLMLLLYQLFDVLLTTNENDQFLDWWIAFWIGAYFPFIFISIRRIIKDYHFVNKTSMFIGLALTGLVSAVIIPIFSYFFENNLLTTAELAAFIIILIIDLMSFIILNILLVLYFRLKYSHFWIFIVTGYAILIFRDLSGVYSFMLEEIYPKVILHVLNLIFFSTILVGLVTLFDKDFSFKTIKDIEAESDYYKTRYDELEYLSKDLITVTELWFHDLKNDINVLENSLLLFEENPKAEFLDIVQKRLSLMRERQEEFQSPVSILDSLKIQPIEVSIINGIQRVFSSVKINTPKEPLYVKANKLLFPIFLNIVQNAFQHGGGNIQVQINVQEEEETVLVQVKDNGIGISDEDKKKIFTKGYIAPGSDSASLGLYLVKLATNKFGAKIDIEDNHPHGTIFFIRLQKIKRE